MLQQCANGHISRGLFIYMRLLFVINPGSGGQSKDTWEQGIAAWFRDSPHSYDWYEMTGEGDAGSLRYWMAHLRPDRIVAVGGHGTLKFLVENLIRSGISIGFLPAGSANAMAKELGLPKTIPEALKIAVEAAPKKMDVVRVNGKHISIHLADLGMNAQLVKYSEQADRRGMWGYVREVLKVLYRKQRISLNLTIDGREMQREVWMVVVANGRYYGTGVAINPEGSLSDGRFEVFLLKQLSPWEILKMILRHRPFNKRKVEVFSATRATIVAAAPAHFQVDGEYVCECDKLD